MEIKFDVEISNTITFIGLTVRNNTVSIQSVELVVFSRLVSRVLVGLHSSHVCIKPDNIRHFLSTFYDKVGQKFLLTFWHLSFTFKF
jgi:hypothetical protein